MFSKRLSSSIKSQALRQQRLFTTSSAEGITIKALDDGKPVTQLSLIFKAGSRYQSEPGVAHLLEKFAFKDTKARSQLRLVRESELLGGQLSSSLSRENIVLTTKFLREDLPYFVQALSDVASDTIFFPHVLKEQVGPVASLESSDAYASPVYTAVEAAHELAFRSGLGNALLIEKNAGVPSINAVAEYSTSAFTKSNLIIAAKGVTPEDLTELVGSKFTSVKPGTPISSDKSSFHGGETRIKSLSAESAVVIAFPTAPSASLTTLSYILGGKSSIKWSLGTSPLSTVAGSSGASVTADVSNYSDASLLYLTVSGSAEAITSAAPGTVKALKDIAAVGVKKEQLDSAVAQAKFADITSRESDLIYAATVDALDYSSVTADSVKKLAADLLKGKVAYTAVGATHKLPYADELF